MVVADSSSVEAVSDVFIDYSTPVDIDMASPELAGCSYGLSILEVQLPRARPDPAELQPSQLLSLTQTVKISTVLSKRIPVWCCATTCLKAASGVNLIIILCFHNRC